MKKFLGSLLTAITLIVLFLVFWPSENLSSTIENLKFALENLICERASPTAISLNYYADEKAGWRAMFAGRNQKDFHLRFAQFSKNSLSWQVILFVFIGDEWKYAQKLTAEENLEFKKINIYSEEEGDFINACAAKIFEYLEKKEKEKRLYTPIAFFLFLQKP